MSPPRETILPEPCLAFFGVGTVVRMLEFLIYLLMRERGACACLLPARLRALLVGAWRLRPRWFPPGVFPQWFKNSAAKTGDPGRNAGG